MMKKIKTFFISHFDSKQFVTILIFIVLLFSFIIVFANNTITLSKYESEVDANISPNLAFFITDLGKQNRTLELGSILPSRDAYFYTFTVSNYKESNRINVNVEYSIKLITTTNLPLVINLYHNSDDYNSAGIVSEEIVNSDENNMYFKEYKVDNVYQFGYQINQTDTYVIKVIFPESYKYNSSDYEGVIELFEIEIDAKQIV